MLFKSYWRLHLQENLWEQIHNFWAVRLDWTNMKVLEIEKYEASDVFVSHIDIKGHAFTSTFTLIIDFQTEIAYVLTQPHQLPSNQSVRQSWVIFINIDLFIHYSFGFILQFFQYAMFGFPLSSRVSVLWAKDFLSCISISSLLVLGPEEHELAPGLKLQVWLIELISILNSSNTD